MVCQTPIAKGLVAQVVNLDGKGKTKVLSNIKIYCGSLLLGETTIGGRYSQVQAIAEYNRNRKSFK